MIEAISKLTRIQKPGDFIKIALGFLCIVILTLLPIIIVVAGGYFESISRGYPSNEGNSSIVAIGWLALFTIPAGIVILVIWALTLLKNLGDYIDMKRSNDKVRKLLDNKQNSESQKN